jgi:hypothetical protein
MAQCAPRLPATAPRPQATLPRPARATSHLLVPAPRALLAGTQGRPLQSPVCPAPLDATAPCPGRLPAQSACWAFTAVVGRRPPPLVPQVILETGLPTPRRRAGACARLEIILQAWAQPPLLLAMDNAKLERTAPQRPRVAATFVLHAHKAATAPLAPARPFPAPPARRARSPLPPAGGSAPPAGWGATAPRRAQWRAACAQQVRPSTLLALPPLAPAWHVARGATAASRGAPPPACNACQGTTRRCPWRLPTMTACPA